MENKARYNQISDRSKRFSTATSMESLGVLDLGDLSDFSASSSELEKRERFSKLLNQSQSKCSSTIEANQVKENTFKIPDLSTTNALLSKRIFPSSTNISNQSNNKTEDFAKPQEKAINKSFNSQMSFKGLKNNDEINSNKSIDIESSLDPRYLRVCSDADWRISSVGDGYFRSSALHKNIFPNQSESQEQFKRDSFTTDGMPTPFKGSQSIIGQNKSMKNIDIDNSFNFRNDQISARSSSLSGSGGSGTYLGTSSNPSSNSNTLKLAHATSKAEIFVTSPKNPFEDNFQETEHNKENVVNLPWLQTDLGSFDNPFSNENAFPEGDFKEEDFLSADEAADLLLREEIEFQNNHQLELPENNSGFAGNSFASFKNDLSSIARPSFCSSSIFGGDVPEKVTKDVLFKAKSGQLGKLDKTSNSHRPYFGVSVDSPLRDDQTMAESDIQRISSVSQKMGQEHQQYLKKLVQGLQIEETPPQSANERFIIQETNSKPSSSGIGSMTNENRSHSASEIENPHGGHKDLRTFRSMENLSPTKKPHSVDHFGSQPNLNRPISSAASCGFSCPSHINFPVHQPAPCFHCYDAARMNYVTPQMHMPYPVPTYPAHSHPMGVPFPVPSQNAAFTSNEIIRGPEEITVHVCWGSNAKVIIPLINSSNQSLSCTFTLVTAFVGNTKVKAETLKLVMPGTFEIPPRTSKDSSVSLQALEEGVTNIWIEISTSLPNLNIQMSSFTCYIKLVIEKPKINVQICGKQSSEGLEFIIPAPSQEIEAKMIKVSNEGKSMVPVIVYLQSETIEGFTFIFPEWRVRNEMDNSNHAYKILSPTILIYHIEGLNSSSFGIPVTVFNNRENDFNGYCEIKGTITISLQCPDKIDQDLNKIPLLAKIGACKIDPRIEIQSIDVTERKSSSVSSSSSRNEFNSQSSTANKSSNTSIRNYQKEIPERDTTVASIRDHKYSVSMFDSSHMTTFNEPKWYLEPENLKFTNGNEKRSFKVHNVTENPMWFKVSDKYDLFHFTPPHGVCHKCSHVTVSLKDKVKQNSEYQIKVSCDGLDKYVKVTVNTSH